MKFEVRHLGTDPPWCNTFGVCHETLSCQNVNKTPITFPVEETGVHVQVKQSVW